MLKLGSCQPQKIQSSHLKFKVTDSIVVFQEQYLKLEVILVWDELVTVTVKK